MSHLLIAIFLPNILFTQDKSIRTELDYLNHYPFIPEKNITGICFVTLADTFDYYKKPIVIKDQKNIELLRIEFNEIGGLVTTYKGIPYHYTYTDHADTLDPFDPWLWSPNPDYFRLAFQCSDTSGDYYKVWLTEKDFAFIPKQNHDFKKESIPDFVKNWTSLGFDFDRSDNPLRQSPTGTAKKIKHPDQTKYKIWKGKAIEIKDDWMKVKTLKGEVGWIKWRSGKKILIRMYFAC